MNTSFIDRCISGDAFLDEVDDYIDEWHDNSISEDTELHEYLGMTLLEYSLWITNPNIIGLIIDARRRGLSLKKMPVEIHALAARAASKEEAQRIMSWLKNTKKLDET
jgi:hypothetical protein